jgi:hypothetical protein
VRLNVRFFRSGKFKETTRPTKIYNGSEIQCHTPFGPTGTDIACSAADTGRFAEIDLMKIRTTRILQYESP